MELINDYSNYTNTYTSKILINRFTEGENIKVEKNGMEDICEFIISNNDNEYELLQKNHRKNYIVNKKLKIADNVIKNEKYTKTFSPKLIQSGLQHMNILSSILYLNELYKINVVIYNENTNKFYKTSYMNYPILLCKYKNNEWFQIEDKEINEEYEYHPIEELSHILTIDSSLMIFKSKMGSISKYKIKELEELCKEENIDTTNNGKKKLKKELYDTLTLHYITKK